MDTLPVELIKDFIPEGRRNRPGIKLKKKYITIHDTGNSNAGADALSHASYIKGDTAANIPVSWHVTIDEYRYVQHLPLNEVAWHAGDGRYGPGNTQSIGLEICMNSDGNRKKAEENAEFYTAWLMNRYSIPLENVVQHAKWINKNCPRILRGRAGGWEKFIDNVRAFYKEITSKGGDPLLEYAIVIFDDPDNDTVGPLARYLGCGVFYRDNYRDLVDENGNLKAKQVYVVGGSDILDEDGDQELIAGADRWLTANEVGKLIRDLRSK